MRNVKWLFVVLLICSLTSFVQKDLPAGGLRVGDKAPDIHLQPLAEQSVQTLSEKRGHMLLLSFWASYDASSRLRNANLSYELNQMAPESVELVSVSLDKYESICLETIRTDQIAKSQSYRGLDNENSELLNFYNLDKGFSNYLIDEKGVIIACDIDADEIPAYLN